MAARSRPFRKSSTRGGAAVRTRRGIFDLLKRLGPQSAQAMSAALGVTAMAVRQHLYELADEGLVAFDAAASRPSAGRPSKLWRLTPAADRYFPDAHAELTVGLLDAVKTALGNAGLEKTLQCRARQTLENYRRRMPASGTLARRVRALAELRSREGYMAGVEKMPDGDTDRPALLLTENHCPICAAASVCQGLCAAELEMFQTLLGPGVRVQRVEHIQAGARRCAYRIEPLKRH